MRDESHSKKNYSVGNESQNYVKTTTLTFLLITPLSQRHIKVSAFNQGY